MRGDVWNQGLLKHSFASSPQVGRPSQQILCNWASLLGSKKNPSCCIQRVNAYATKRASALLQEERAC